MWTSPVMCHLGLLPVAVLCACSGPDEACTAEARPAIEVEVRSAPTDEFIAVATRGVARDGSYEDSLRVTRYIGNDPALPTTLGGAYERAGTYEVHLESIGYEPWDTAGVLVTAGVCHVETVVFTAYLVPAS